jgi:hypothetical protein
MPAGLVKARYSESFHIGPRRVFQNCALPSKYCYHQTKCRTERTSVWRARLSGNRSVSVEEVESIEGEMSEMRPWTRTILIGALRALAIGNFNSRSYKRLGIHRSEIRSRRDFVPPLPLGRTDKSVPIGCHARDLVLGHGISALSSHVTALDPSRQAAPHAGGHFPLFLRARRLLTHRPNWDSIVEAVYAPAGFIDRLSLSTESPPCEQGFVLVPTTQLCVSDPVSLPPIVNFPN